MSQANNQYDLCIIGGGINGAGIARDASGRGLKVLLVEKDDLASATSSASTKLVHGGLRYLEYYEFRLVHEALLEREVLLRIAPHIIWPMNFVLPHAYSIRPFWLVRCGLYLYDLLSLSWGPRKFPLSRAFNLRNHSFGEPLKEDYFLGLLYSDGWVQDSRLVVLNAMDAKASGAEIRTRTECTNLKPVNNGWDITLNSETGSETVHARMVVNAAGPWVHHLLHDNKLETDKTPDVRLVQGSHIVVPKLHTGNQSYMLQQPDKRIVFAIPYEGEFTLIGTTDTDFTGDPKKTQITDDEIDYLLTAANLYFVKQISRSDIVWTYSGLRPLLDDERSDAKKVTRDYKIHDDEFNGSHLVSVFGGKITTYRKLAESVMHKVSDVLGIPDKSWTGKRALPGGDVPSGDFEAFMREQRIRWEMENVSLLRRYARTYGTKMIDILTKPKGVHYGDGIYEAEIRYLITREFARTTEDILWRRTKLGLHIKPETKANLEAALPELLKELAS